MHPVSTALRDARRKAGITQIALADTLGISQSFLHDIEQGRRALGEKYFPQLPEPIRTAVIKAAVEEHHMAANRIRRYKEA